MVGNVHLTWERVALGILGFSMLLMGAIGSLLLREMDGWRGELRNWNNTITSLNDTLSQLRVDIAINKTTVVSLVSKIDSNFQTNSRRIDDTRDWTGKLSARLNHLELVLSNKKKK